MRAACVDLRSNPNHCGQCGNSCSGAQVCVLGACALLPPDCSAPGANFGHDYFSDPVTRTCKPGCRLDAECPPGATCDTASATCTCPAGQHVCGQQCVSSTAVESCGTQGIACPTTANGVATCSASTCGIACAMGYSRSGSTCVDVNECLSGNGGCSANATCTNTVGSRTCACDAGFTGDGVTCTDVNECLTDNGGCDPNAACTNTTGSRVCACNAGYTGTGLTCADVDECLTNNGGCATTATCTNTPGSRTCACNPGKLTNPC